MDHLSFLNIRPGGAAETDAPTSLLRITNHSRANSPPRDQPLPPAVAATTASPSLYTRRIHESCAIFPCPSRRSNHCPTPRHAASSTIRPASLMHSSSPAPQSVSP